MERDEVFMFNPGIKLGGYRSRGWLLELGSVCEKGWYGMSGRRQDPVTQGL